MEMGQRLDVDNSRPFIRQQKVVGNIFARPPFHRTTRGGCSSRPPWLIDRFGARGAASDIAGIKVVVPRAVAEVIDRAIQVRGGAGISNDVPALRVGRGNGQPPRRSARRLVSWGHAPARLDRHGASVCWRVDQRCDHGGLLVVGYAVSITDRSAPAT